MRFIRTEVARSFFAHGAKSLFMSFFMLLGVNAFAYSTSELIINGDFEMDDKFWTGDTYSIIQDNEIDGDYFAYMGSAGEDEMMMQENIVIPGEATKATLSFDYFYWDDENSVDGFGAVALFDHYNHDNILKVIFFSNEDDTGLDIYHGSIDITALKGKSVDVVLSVLNAGCTVGSCDNNLGIDNISIQVEIPLSAPIAIYRFYSEKFQTHFYTISEVERNHIIKSYPTNEWSYEGQAYKAHRMVGQNLTPIYRFWSNTKSKHFYTISKAEKEYIESGAYPEAQWTYEGIAWYAGNQQTPDTTPLYRFYSQDHQAHFYTLSKTEKEYIQKTYPVHIWN